MRRQPACDTVDTGLRAASHQQKPALLSQCQQHIIRGIATIRCAPPSGLLLRCRPRPAGRLRRQRSAQAALTSRPMCRGAEPGPIGQSRSRATQRAGGGCPPQPPPTAARNHDARKMLGSFLHHAPWFPANTADSMLESPKARAACSVCAKPSRGRPVIPPVQTQWSLGSSLLNSPCLLLSLLLPLLLCSSACLLFCFFPPSPLSLTSNCRNPEDMRVYLFCLDFEPSPPANAAAVARPQS